MISVAMNLDKTNKKIDRNRENDQKESREGLSEIRAATYGRDTRALMNESHIKLLRKNAPLLKRFGTAAAESFFNSYLVHDQDETISFDGQQAAIASNIEFWNYLSELQGRRKNPIKVFVTHSNSLNIWESARAEPLYDAQKKFTVSGGVICRIFVSLQEYIGDEMIDRYIGVMKKMNGKGIQTAYLPHSIEAATTSGRERYDFIFTEIDKELIALSWSASTHNNYILSSRMEINTGLYDKNKDDWAYIFNELKNFDYDNYPLSNIPDTDFLKEQRKSVIESISE